MVTINLRAPLKQRVGASSIDVEGATVREALRALEEAAPEISGWVTDEQGEIRRHVNVFVNGEPSRAADQLTSGDRIDIIHAITGG